MRIFISYSGSETVTFCFWKYFLEASGIWVSANKITDEWKAEREQFPHLVILNADQEGRIARSAYPNYIYLVRKRDQPQWCSPEEWKARRDVIKLQWWGMRGSPPHMDVLKNLLAGTEIEKEMCELLEIFWQTKLWGAAWLFHEIAQKDKGRWDEEIYEYCREADGRLKNKKGWNAQFMALYCQYIECGVRDRGSAARMRGCRMLLKKCDSMAEQYGWTPSLLVLTGKICTLSSTENKCAISYYESAAAYEKQASLYYDIGHLYEKACGEMETAFLYYKKAFQCDRYYYKALYKLAGTLREREKWMEAMSIYGEILTILLQNKSFDSISICEIEYYYKANKNIKEILEEYISNAKMIEQYRREIQEVYEHPENWCNLHLLMRLMFGREHEAEKCDVIWQEIQKKFNTKCFQTG